MMRVNIRGFSKVLFAVVVLAMMTGSTQAGQDPQPTYTPDGTWLPSQLPSLAPRGPSWTHTHRIRPSSQVERYS